MTGRNPIDRYTGEPIRCYLCQSVNHVITNCPRFVNRNSRGNINNSSSVYILGIFNSILILLNLFLIFNRH